MLVKIDFDKSVGENASKKYKKRKKYISKIKGLKKARKNTKKKLEKIQNKKKLIKEKKYKKIVKKEKEWYEKYRWFFTSNNYLVISGRDAKNNEEVVKKHLDIKDLYFHADTVGAPHTVLKNGKESKDQDKKEGAKFAACFSSAWKSKIFSLSVYSVESSQVTKTAKSGESLGTGAFVIRGKRKYYNKIDLELAIGFSKKLNKVIIGPKSAIKKQSKFVFIVVPGDKKKSDIAKILLEKFKEKNINVDTNNLISILPAGKSKLK